MLNINELKRLHIKDRSKSEESINDFYLTKKFDLNDTELIIFKAAMERIDHGTLEVLETVISVLTLDKLNPEQLPSVEPVKDVTVKETSSNEQVTFDNPYSMFLWMYEHRKSLVTKFIYCMDTNSNDFSPTRIAKILGVGYRPVSTDNKLHERLFKAIIQYSKFDKVSIPTQVEYNIERMLALRHVENEDGVAYGLKRNESMLFALYGNTITIESKILFLESIKPLVRSIDGGYMKRMEEVFDLFIGKK